MSDDFTNRKVSEDDSPEFQAARIRLGLEHRQPKKHIWKRLFAKSDFTDRARYAKVEDKVLDEKEAEHKVSRCRWCRDTIWLDAFGEKWKAEGGSPLCGKAPFMTHEPHDG